jgi:hypothetical protein
VLPRLARSLRCSSIFWMLRMPQQVHLLGWSVDAPAPPDKTNTLIQQAQQITAGRLFRSTAQKGGRLLLMLTHAKAPTCVLARSTGSRCSSVNTTLPYQYPDCRFSIAATPASDSRSVRLVTLVKPLSVLLTLVPPAAQHNRTIERWLPSARPNSRGPWWR